MSAHSRYVDLRNKIMELRQALFFMQNEGVLKIPTSVVNILHVDDAGQAWFMVRRPQQRISEFERESPARLEFYKKGKPFYLKVKGEARIIADPEELAAALELLPEGLIQPDHDHVLIKVRVRQMSCYPLKQPDTAVEKKTTVHRAHPLTMFKSLQYIVKDIIPVFQSH